MVTRHEYDAAGRLLRSVEASPWTEEDRVLMLAWRQYQNTRCKCGEDRRIAWHPDMEGWYSAPEDLQIVCWACTARARAGDEESGREHPTPPVKYPQIVTDRDFAADPLPPWDAMTAPTDPPADAPDLQPGQEV